MEEYMEAEFVIGVLVEGGVTAFIPIDVEFGKGVEVAVVEVAVEERSSFGYAFFTST